ncbi:MAG: hypothetical protein ACYCY6_01590 [Minisyncoccota bacterium]
MSFSRTQQQEAYKKLPSDTQDFIMLNETTDNINLLLRDSGLEKSTLQKADSEILFAMTGLQNLDAAIENISKISNKTPADYLDLKSKLKDQVFNKLDKLKKDTATTPLISSPGEETLQSIPEIKKVEQEIGPEILVEVPKPSDTNQKSVNLIPPPAKEEEILLEPPKPDASPASLAPVDSATPAIQTTSAPTTAPQDNPKLKDFEERKKFVPEMPSNKPHYPTGNDPYREPIN